MTIPEIDPWAGAAVHDEYRRNELPPERQWPLRWQELSPEQRRLLGGLAHAVIDHFRDYAYGRLSRVAFLGHRLHEAVRGTTDPAARGEFGFDAAAFYQPDAARRKQWTLIRGVIEREPSLLPALIQGIDLLADLRKSLLRRRQEIEQTLQSLVDPEELRRLIAEDHSAHEAAKGRVA